MSTPALRNPVLGRRPGPPVTTLGWWILLEVIQRLRSSWAWALALYLLVAIPSSAGPATTALLVARSSAWWGNLLTLTVAAPLALASGVRESDALARSVGAGSAARAMAPTGGSMLVAFGYLGLMTATNALWIVSSDSAALSLQDLFDTSLQTALYIAPVISLCGSIRATALGVAERALGLAILVLLTHRILLPHGFPLDLLALHPAGDCWAQSARGLGESMLLSGAGIVAGALFSAVVGR